MNRVLFHSKLISLFIFCYYTPMALSAVDLDTTRVIYHSSNEGEDIRVKNNSNIPNLVQSWVDAGNGKTDVPFIVTPPLFRLDGGGENKISIMYVGEGLEKDQETLYWLNVKSIPSIDPNASKNKVIIAINHRIKMIYRPDGLPGESEDAIEKIQWTKTSSNVLQANNNSPYYVTLNQLTVNGKSIPIALSPDNSTISPHSSLTYSLVTKPGIHTDIEWQAIGDLGKKSKLYKKTI